MSTELDLGCPRQKRDLEDTGQLTISPGGLENQDGKMVGSRVRWAAGSASFPSQSCAVAAAAVTDL